MATSALTVSQISCFSSINHKLPLRRRSLLLPSLSLSRSKLFIAMSVEGGEGTDFSTSDIKHQSSTDPLKSYGSAKIHDFCFGIPYGGVVLSGGFLGFLFSRNTAVLSTGVIYGGALLALSFLSLKIWRQGKSSVPFVLGQAVLSAALFWKNYQAYALTKKLIPTGFYAAISAAMLCFYSYVMVSGGNPPPKKLQSPNLGS